MSEVIGSFCSSLPLENCCGCRNLVQEISLPLPVTRGFVEIVALLLQTARVSLHSFEVILVNKDVCIESKLFVVRFSVQKDFSSVTIELVTVLRVVSVPFTAGYIVNVDCVGNVLH